MTKNKNIKLIRILDIISKITLFLYVLVVLFFAYQIFLFDSCYNENLKNIREFLGLYVYCSKGMGVAVAMVYISMIKIFLLILFPFVVGFRLVVYFYAKNKYQQP